jgi:hypothetical protein
MKGKMYLVSETFLKLALRGKLNRLNDKDADIFIKSKQPVSTLDRDKVEQELYDMIGGLNETEYGEQINECVHIASKNICSLAVQPDRDREKIMLKAIKAYQRMVSAYRVGEKELPEWVFQNIGEFKAICKKGEKDE